MSLPGLRRAAPRCSLATHGVVSRRCWVRDAIALAQAALASSDDAPGAEVSEHVKEAFDAVDAKGDGVLDGKEAEAAGEETEQALLQPPKETCCCRMGVPAGPPR